MQFTINIEKKHAMMIFVVIFLMGTVFFVKSQMVDELDSWHPVSQISKSDIDLTSIDANGNGIVDFVNAGLNADKKIVNVTEVKEPCDAKNEGVLRYNDENIEYCDGNMWGPLADGSPLLAGGISGAHTEEECTENGGTVISADSMNLCTYEPNIGGHDCTTLNCLYDIDTGAHMVAWECPNGWQRYENWGSYNEYCWAVDYSWNPRCEGDWYKRAKTSTAWGISYCNGGPYGMPSVWNSWDNTLAPSTQGRNNLCASFGSDSFNCIVGYNQYVSNTAIYGGAATGDGRGQVKAYSIMDAIGCY